jgi:hypothetical protein
VEPLPSISSTVFLPNSSKQTQKALPPSEWSAFEASARSLYPQMARITITPEWAKPIDFETRFPVAVQDPAGHPP